VPNDSKNPSNLIQSDEFEQAVSPKDLRGRINLRTDKMMQEEIEDIAEDSRYPLNSVSQVVRFCCLLGLERLRLWKPAPTLLGAIKAANQIISRDKMQTEAQDLIQRLGERVEWYLQHKHYDEVLDLVAKVRCSFDNIEGSFWADNIRKEIDLKFEEWLGRIDKLREIDSERGH